MTREEAKQAIAARCGTTLESNRENLSYCRFAGCPFGTNLLGHERSPNKKTGFYFYSHEPFDASSVMGPWLQSKLREAGFQPGEYEIRMNRSESEVEGHVADFYLDMDWERLTDGDLSRIRALYDRLKTFQTERWPEDEAVRNNQIRAFNAANAETVRAYLRNRGREVSDAGETTPSRPIPDTDDIQLTDWEEKARDLLLANYQLVFTGAPGTGKTHAARRIAAAVAGDASRIASVQFHPGYDYSDFVIGMKPILLSESGKEIERKNGRYVEVETDVEIEGNAVGKARVSFRWKDGIFKKFADEARKAYNAAEDKENAPRFVFLVDEINRADLSRVFGELFSLLEDGYRYPNENGSDSILLPNGDRFSIPKNLFVIGTMNDIDRSVESMDFALRRRFAWKEVKPEDTADAILATIPQKEALLARMNAVNELIRSDDFRLGCEYQLGGAIFAKFGKCGGDFERLWKNHIEIILNEYLRGRRDRKELVDKLKAVFDGAPQTTGTTMQPAATAEATPGAQ